MKFGFRRTKALAINNIDNNGLLFQLSTLLLVMFRFL